MPFALALALSVLLHAAAIVVPGWDLPGANEPDAPPLEAHLAPPPRPAPTPVEKRQAPPKKKAAPAATPAATTVDAPAATAAVPLLPPPPVVETPPTPFAEPPAVASDPLPLAAPTPAPAPPWPSRGRVRYLVTYGESGFVLGETIHEWRVVDGHYSIHSVFAPKGLAAIVAKTREQTSAGEVTADGLRSSEFRDRREGRAEETASFDWSAGRVVFSSGRSDSRLTPGTQDMLSVFYQLAWLAPRRDVELVVVTSSRLDRWTFEWLGEEQLELAPATVSTLHWRTRADGETTEVWLAPTYGGLPVKIRYVDRKGDVFEQAADLLELNQ